MCVNSPEEHRPLARSLGPMIRQFEWFSERSAVYSPGTSCDDQSIACSSSVIHCAHALTKPLSPINLEHWVRVSYSLVQIKTRARRSQLSWSLESCQCVRGRSVFNSFFAMKTLALVLLLALAMTVVVSTSTYAGGQLSTPSYSLGVSLVLSGAGVEAEPKAFWGGRRRRRFFGRRRRRINWNWLNKRVPGYF